VLTAPEDDDMVAIVPREQPLVRSVEPTRPPQAEHSRVTASTDVVTAVARLIRSCSPNESVRVMGFSELEAETFENWVEFRGLAERDAVQLATSPAEQRIGGEGTSGCRERKSLSTARYCGTLVEKATP
jgi:hypothetical protein